MIQLGDMLLNWSRSLNRRSRRLLTQATELSNRSKRILGELEVNTTRAPKGDEPK